MLLTATAAAVPAVMACHFSEILGSQRVHCACNHIPHMVRAADMPQMGASFAPAPQMFLSVTGDWTRRFPEHGLPEIAAIYELCGARERVDGRQWDQGHDYDRPMRNAMYAFFERWLRGDGDPDPELEPEGIATESLETLAKLDRDDVPRDPAAIAAEFRGRLAAPALTRADVVGEGAPARRDAARRRLADLFEGGALDPTPDLRALGSGTWRGRVLARWSVRAEPEIELPVLSLGLGPGPVVIVLAPGGKAEVLGTRAAWIERILARGAAVVLPDLRYTGELDQGARWRDLYGRFFGLDEGVLAVRDLRRVIDSGLVAGSAAVVAFGETAATAVFAAALDARIGGVIAPDLGPTYRSAARSPAIGRILLHGDLPEAACLLAPRPLVAGGVPELGEYRAARAAHPRLELATQPLRLEELDAALAAVLPR